MNYNQLYRIAKGGLCDLSLLIFYVISIYSAKLCKCLLNTVLYRSI